MNDDERSALCRQLDALASGLRRRILLRGWTDALQAAAIPSFAAAALGLLLLTVGLDGGPSLGAVALLVVGAWIALAGCAALVNRPSADAAVAAFDQAADNGELFLSARNLARDAGPGPGLYLHLARARRELDGARAQVRRLFPLRMSARTILPPLLFLLTAFLLPAPASLDDGSPTRSPAAKAEPARSQRNLEERAAEAARRIQALHAPLQLPGPRVLDALARHRDTARLADALREDDPEQAGEELDKLARRLRAAGLSESAKQRVESALAHGLSEADAEDRKSAFARRAADARRALESGSAGDAASALERLATRLRDQAGRMRRIRALDAIAQSLRAEGAAQAAALRASARRKDGGGPARIGVGSAPYESRPGTLREPRRDERVPARAGTSAPGSAPRKGADPLRPSSPPGTVRVRLDDVPESALPGGTIPRSLAETVRRYFASLRAGANR